MFEKRKFKAEKTQLNFVDHVTKLFGQFVWINDDFYVWRVKFASNAQLTRICRYF